MYAQNTIWWIPATLVHAPRTSTTRHIWSLSPSYTISRIHSALNLHIALRPSYLNAWSLPYWHRYHASTPISHGFDLGARNRCDHSSSISPPFSLIQRATNSSSTGVFFQCFCDAPCVLVVELQCYHGVAVLQGNLFNSPHFRSLANVASFPFYSLSFNFTLLYFTYSLDSISCFILTYLHSFSRSDVHSLRKLLPSLRKDMPPCQNSGLQSLSSVVVSCISCRALHS